MSEKQQAEQSGKRERPKRSERSDRSDRRGGGASEGGESSFDSRVVEIRRTTKVREGGRDFSFSAVVVVGDGKGRVGYGRGKAKEVVSAVSKASDAARRNMITVPLRKGTLQYSVTHRYGATKIVMCPGVDGTGIIAGGAMRPVFEVLGIKNVIAKCIGSSNPTNVVRATIESLEAMKTPKMVAEKRGKTVKEVFGMHHQEKQKSV
jgi:small subunit ribosomal protein S5